MDLRAYAGRPFRAGWEVDVDDAPVAAPWVARCQVREDRRLDAPLLHTFTTVIDAGAVIITATAVETAGWAWAEGKFDAIIDNGAGEVITIDEGTFTVGGSVTV